MTAFRKTGKVYELVNGDATRYRMEEIYRMIAKGTLHDGDEIKWHDLFDEHVSMCVVSKGTMILKSKLQPDKVTSKGLLPEMSLHDIFEWLKMHDPVTPQRLYEYVYGPGFDAKMIERLLDKMECNGYSISEDKRGWLYAAEQVHSHRYHGVLLARAGN
jgi:hypothetical protein